MCRPPDLAPVSASNEYGGDAFHQDETPMWDERAALEVALLQAKASSLLGKRGLQHESQLLDETSRAGKLPRPGPSVSSAFDSAAASFMAKMEQSMMHDLQRQQQQKNLAAAATSLAEDAVLQRALLQQQSKLQQLQQLHLLKQLQAKQTAPVPQITTEQQQLLFAQQQIMQQAQQPVSALGPAAGKTADSLWNGNANLEALMKKGLGVNPSVSPVAQPPLLPKAPEPSASALAALLGAKATPAALLGFGASAMPPYQTAALAFEDEKKNKRMQSNRASAKRSRQRRQARLEELDKSTAQLQEENSTLCDKLEAAHEQIHELVEKNRTLSDEVADLRKMLGMTAHSSSNDFVKAGSEAALSRGLYDSSCVVSEDSGHGSAESLLPVKLEVDTIGEVNDGEGVDQLNSLLGLGETQMEGLDQLLPQGDVLSELLACLDD